MSGIYHPFSRAYYVRDDDGNVTVTAPDGSTGTFEANGRWVRGEVRAADPQLCGWVAGVRFVHHRLVQND
ncbi:MAG: hypothetical protein R2715_19845 [Ilumatobacteraceae bacterium]